MKQKLLFIINPKAGKGKISQYLLDIITLFSQSNYEVNIITTQYPNHVGEIVKEQGANYSIIVCCGGDGTLNQTINALMELEIKPLLGYIPAGTTNDFATGLNIPKQPLKAAEAIINGRAFQCDIGLFNQIHFSYVAAFGSIAEVTYETPQKVKNSLGYLAYVLEAFKKFNDHKSYHLKISYDDKTIEGDFIFGVISNSKIIGGFKNPLNQSITLDDGVLDVALIKKPHSLTAIQDIINTTLQINVENGTIVHFTTSKLEIISNKPVQWTLDGEFGGNYAVASIQNLHKAITIQIPSEELTTLD